MSRDVASFHELEKRVLARLKDRGVAFEEFDLGYFPENLKGTAVNVGVSSSGFEQTANKTIKAKAKIRILVAVKVLKAGDETERRAKSLPLCEAIIRELLLQDLGLSIDAIVPTALNYRTAPEGFREGWIVWELLFETRFSFEKIPDEETSLNSIFVEYFLQDPSDDNIADASDLIEVPQ